MLIREGARERRGSGGHTDSLFVRARSFGGCDGARKFMSGMRLGAAVPQLRESSGFQYFGRDLSDNPNFSNRRVAFR